MISIDNMLSLRWYDAEGCIVTQPIDIIGRLPLFVVMVEARSHGATLDDSAHTDVQGTSSVFVENNGTGGGRLKRRKPM